MFRFATLFLILASGGSAAAYACERPEPIRVPDGKTASEAEMIEAGKVLKSYIEKSNVYLECLKAQNESNRMSGKRLSLADAKANESDFVEKNNAAAGALQSTMDAFDKAVAEFKARQ